MRTIAVIPVKPPGEGKSRLEGALDDADRAALIRSMFRRVLRAVIETGIEAIVVSRDASIRREAEAAGAWALDEHGGSDLNEALETARVFLSARGAEALLVLPADLPSIEPDDVRALMTLAWTAPAVVVAPDAAGQGTNALLLAPADSIAFGFGPDSFARHCEAARKAGITPMILRRPGLALDLDTPADLERLRRLDGR
jgi:2-phospho-L-lactate guanylyltransferase